MASNAHSTISIKIEYIRCPLTGLIFLNPVIATDGHVYENTAICTHLKTSLRSPLTRKTISKRLTPVLFLQTIIDEFIKTNPEMKAEQFQEIAEPDSDTSDTESDSDGEIPTQQTHRIPTAYNLFVRSNIQIVKQKHPSSNQIELLAIIAKMWKSEKRNADEAQAHN